MTSGAAPGGWFVCRHSVLSLRILCLLAFLIGLQELAHSAVTWL